MTARVAPTQGVVLPREDVIRDVATRLFRERGYGATTMRELAREVGIEAASLYNHFPSKHDLLADILIGVMERLVGGIRRALQETGPDPVEQLRTAITAYVLMHRDSLEEASISDSERRSLAPPKGTRLLALRRELSDLFKDIIERGRKEGRFVVDDLSVATISVLSICARLPVWYQPGGRLSLEEIAQLLSDVCLRAVGVQPVQGGRAKG